MVTVNNSDYYNNIPAGRDLNKLPNNSSAGTTVGYQYDGLTEEDRFVQKVLREHYDKMYKENMSHSDPMAYVISKYCDVTSPNFCSYMTEDQRSIAYRTEKRMLQSGGKPVGGFARYDYALRNYKDVYTGGSRSVGYVRNTDREKQHARSVVNQQISNLLSKNGISISKQADLVFSIDPYTYQLTVSGNADRDTLSQIEKLLNEGDNAKNIWTHAWICMHDADNEIVNSQANMTKANQYSLWHAKFETVVVQPSDYQQDMVADLSERAAAVHSGMVDPSEDNMLKITGDGRKLGLDQRLINPLLPDDPESKLNACVQNVLRIWEEGKADRLTQLLFCDLSTPKNDGTFNVYDDIKAKLIAAGVPEKEIAFIHDADSEAKKKELFAKVRTGQVRVLMGSTQKMGAGTNCQDRLVALHHLDVGWRPSDMTQRNGRIIRQGNQNKEVQIYQYVTEGTFDAYLYQTLENKQKFISQIMTSKSPVRSCDDVDEQALSYAEIKALCAGNPLIKEKMDLDIDVARLKVLKADHQSQQYRMEDKLLKYFPAEIERQTGYIRGFEADIQTVTTHPQIVEGFCGMEILGKHYMEKEDAGEMILAACKEMKATEPIPLGSYRGFQMELSFDSFRHDFDITLKGAVSHRVSLGTDARGNIIRLDNALSSIPEKLEKAHEQLTNLQNQQEATRAELGKPFPQEAELAEKSARLAELDAALNMEDSMPEREEAEQADKPSVLADLKAKSEHIPPYRASGGREEVL